MRVISTERSQILASRIADALGTKISDVKFSRFPDGEQYLLAGKPDEDMVIVGSIVDNDALVQLLLLIDACDCSTNRLVIPYMGYARQDKRLHDGEPISARAIARVLGRGVESCMTVNIHDKSVVEWFDVPTRNITLAKDIGEYIASANLDNPLVLAPDEGALAFARDVAGTGDWDFDHLEKTRISGVEVKMAPKNVCAASRTVVIVDDIISTGGTIATAAGMLLEQGAREIYAACVHGVLTSGAYARLKSNGIRDIVCSDTIERGCSRFSAANRIAESLR